MSRLIERMRERFALAIPERAELPTQELPSAGLAAISFAVLDCPLDLSDDVASLPAPGVVIHELVVEPECLDVSIELSAPEVHEFARPLRRPEQVSIDPGVIGWSGSIDLLDPLDTPRRAGKAYGEQAGQSRPQPVIEGDNSQARCKHGLLRQACAICRSQAQAPAPRAVAAKPVTVDVFDLLLPLLYPPIGPSTPTGRASSRTWSRGWANPRPMSPLHGACWSPSGIS